MNEHRPPELGGEIKQIQNLVWRRSGCIGDPHAHAKPAFVQALLNRGLDGSLLFDSGGTVEYDNMAIYKSTKLTVNGSYGSWALYQNDGTTPVGTCSTSSIVDYATATSFPADYAAGSASQIKVFPAGVSNCSGAPAATYAGSPGNEIFGGDVFTFTP